jgi:hypothetical protein
MITIRNENDFIVATMTVEEAKEVRDQLGEIFYDLDPSAVFEDWPDTMACKFFEQFANFMDEEVNFDAE